MGYSIKADELVLTPDKGADEYKSVWEVVWNINERKDEKRFVGKIWFSGEPERGVVELNFDIEPRFKERDYAREALRAIVEWVFAKRDLYEIKTTVSTEEEDKIDAIERVGFVLRMANKEVEHYSVVKPRTTWMGLYIVIGVITGMALGIVLGSVIVGVAIGIVIGIITGALLDGKSNMDRSRVTGEKKTTHRKAVIEIENKDEDKNLTEDENKEV